MTQRFIRIYKKLDVNEVGRHLMIYGALSASCANCKTLGLKIDTLKCPQCQTDFKYISFQNVKDHLPKMQRLHDERPELIFVDYEDFKKQSGAIKAEEFLK